MPLRQITKKEYYTMVDMERKMMANKKQGVYVGELLHYILFTFRALLLIIDLNTFMTSHSHILTFNYSQVSHQVHVSRFMSSLTHLSRSLERLRDRFLLRRSLP